MRLMHEKKSHDYAQGAKDPLNNYSCSAADNGLDPWRVALVRLSEKYWRLISLTKNGTRPQCESIEDNLLDIASMALIIRALLLRVDKT